MKSGEWQKSGTLPLSEWQKSGRVLEEWKSGEWRVGIPKINLHSTPTLLSISLSNCPSLDKDIFLLYYSKVLIQRIPGIRNRRNGNIPGIRKTLLPLRRLKFAFLLEIPV